MDHLGVKVFIILGLVLLLLSSTSTIIKSLFNKDPALRIRKAINKKHELAMQLQRNGKLREYAEIMKQIEDLEEDYEKASSES